MDIIRLTTPTEEYLDQVWDYRQECLDAASRRTILANGGKYECTVHEPGADIDLERYWIVL